jgi:hypothetical protein
MLERDEALCTWALAGEPFSALAIDAEQLPDHRLAYLDYEGPVSGDRGSVSRWDAGVYRLESDRTSDRWKIAMNGARLSGLLILERREPGSHFWRVSFSAVPTTG